MTLFLGGGLRIEFLGGLVLEFRPEGVVVPILCLNLSLLDFSIAFFFFFLILANVIASVNVLDWNIISFHTSSLRPLRKLETK